MVRGEDTALSPREREVAKARGGRSIDREIGERLFIAKRRGGTSNKSAKLGFHSRAQSRLGRGHD